MLRFGPFALDEDTGQVWHEGTLRPLRTKSFVVLRELVRNRGRLVTKEELLHRCWPDTAVSSTVVRVCIREIRTALAADPTGSTVVETVGRRGYRLAAAGPEVIPSAAPLIGRDRELSALGRALALADDGLRQFVLVSGEAGLGKTTLLHHFVEQARTQTRARIAWGQCVELTSGAEPYLPILHMLERLCAEDGDGSAIAALERWAPSWLVQLPGLVEGARSDALRRRVPAPNRHRMLRELGSVLEALARERALVLIVEDLHWSDVSSAEALAYVAQCIDPARILLVASYRPIDLTLDAHPVLAVKRALVARRRAVEVALRPLTLANVEAYLARRLDSAVDEGLTREIHARTGGNPLFMVATLDYLLERALLVPVGGRWRLDAALDATPETLRQLILQQLDRLSPLERRVLDAASAAGREFAVALVASACDLPEREVEEACSRIAQRNDLVAPAGVASWPDGTASACYAFRHVLYRVVLEEALGDAVRRQLHRAIGRRLAEAHRGNIGEVAAQLAVHSAAAGDHARAAEHHVAAAAASKSRFADREVVFHQRAALEHLRGLAPTAERERTELASLLELGAALVATKGAAYADVEAVHRRALELADALELPQARIQAHSALYIFNVMRADLPAAFAVAQDILSTAALLPVPFFAFIGHTTVGCALMNLGDFAGAAGHLDAAQRMWEPAFPLMPFDPTLILRAMLGFTFSHRGDGDAGLRWLGACLDIAREMNSPYNLSYAHELAAQYFANVGDRERALEHASASEALAAEHGFVVHLAVVSIVRGWARRDISLLRGGIEAYEGLGQYVATSFFRALLVEVLLEHGHVEDAADELSRTFAFVERSGERRHVAELYRLQGECQSRRLPTASGTRNDAALSSFEQALAIALDQGVELFARRAEQSLARARGGEGPRPGSPAPI